MRYFTLINCFICLYADESSSSGPNTPAMDVSSEPTVSSILPPPYIETPSGKEILNLSILNFLLSITAYFSE